MPPTAVASWGGKRLTDSKSSYGKYHWASDDDIGPWSYCPLAFQLIGIAGMPLGSSMLIMWCLLRV